ncbi:hypothetical protein FOZ63_021006, partial [Perkinsus olseni]
TFRVMVERSRMVGPSFPMTQQDSANASLVKSAPGMPAFYTQPGKTESKPTGSTSAKAGPAGQQRQETGFCYRCLKNVGHSDIDCPAQEPAHRAKRCPCGSTRHKAQKCRMKAGGTLMCRRCGNHARAGVPHRSGMCPLTLEDIKALDKPSTSGNGVTTFVTLETVPATTGYNASCFAVPARPQTTAVSAPNGYN